VSDQNGLLWDEGGVSQDMQDICNDKCRRFMTVLDKVLNVGESAWGKSELASFTQEAS
jgi:hypothetical protein